ncbi:MAG: hypothetical protein KAI40_09685 [Desulfobacterales bacterium]|nr:hypothetical protein [Desulfobacterales bacterium]
MNKSFLILLSFTFFLLSSLFGCVSSSGERGSFFGKKSLYKVAFEAGAYNSGLKEIEDIIKLSSPEEKPKLQKRYSKVLFSYAWEKFEGNTEIVILDDCFKLASAGKEYATDALLSSKPLFGFGLTYGEKYNKISHIFAQYHYNSAHIALESSDLKLALVEFQIASKATNDIGQQAHKEFIKWSKKRSDLKLKLGQANEAINQEHYAKGKALIDQVYRNDISLRLECAELAKHLDKQQYNSIIKDAQALLEKNMFIPSFDKANEAVPLSNDPLEARDIKTKIQEKFALHIKKDKDKALAGDKRHQLISLVKQFEQLEMFDHRDALQKIVQARSEADKQLELSHIEIASGRHESAISYLEKASNLWPENKNVKNLHRQTCLYVANSALGKAKKFINQKHPMLGLLYCLKARTVCPREKGIMNQFAILTNQASRLIDKSSMMFEVSIDIDFGQNVNTTFDTQKLQKEIVLLFSQESQFVKVVLHNENMSTNNKTFTIDVDIKDFNIKTEKNMFFDNIRYVSYVANDPNPNYIELQTQLVAAQDKMTSAQISYQQAVQMRNQAIQRQRAIGSGGSGLFNLLNAGSMVVGTFGMEEAKDDLSSANSEYRSLADRMSNTPPTIPRKVYSDYQYSVEEYKRTGFLKVAVKFINPENQILMQKLITDTFDKSDQTHSGYSPADLDNDPLELISEKEIEVNFTEQIFLDVPNVVSSFISDHWDGILHNIEKELKTSRRWERRLTIALQVPSRKDYILGEITNTETYLPDNIIAEIDAILKKQSSIE